MRKTVACDSWRRGPVDMLRSDGAGGVSTVPRFQQADNADFISSRCQFHVTPGQGSSVSARYLEVLSRCRSDGDMKCTLG